MAANLGSLRKSRAGHLRVLERRLANLDRELRECEGADALQKDKSLIGPARYTSSKCEESLNHLAEAIESIENSISSADPPIEQTKEQRDGDCEVEQKYHVHHAKLDEMNSFLARCEVFVDSISQPSAPIAHRPQASAKPQIKAPQMLEHDVDLSSFKTWRQSFIDYATATGIINEDRDRIVAHLRALLSTKMKSTLEHSIGVDASSTLGVTEILDLCTHIFVRPVQLP